MELVKCEVPQGSVPNSFIQQSECNISTLVASSYTYILLDFTNQISENIL